MPEAAEVLKTAFTIGKMIYDQAMLAKANRAQCKRLAGRVNIALDACQGLDFTHNSQQYLQGLLSLQSTLGQCLEFVRNFTRKHWVHQFIRAKGFQNQFNELAQSLLDDTQMLQLGIGAQQIVNRDEDKQDWQADVVELKDSQETILDAAKANQAKLTDVHNDQAAQTALLAKQLQSMREHLTAIVERPAFQVSERKPTDEIDAKLIVPFHELEFIEKIAKGTFATVYRGRWLQTEVAIKIIDHTLTAAERREFIREVAIQSRLHHPHIVPLYGASVEPSRACIVMRYCEQQSLRHVLQSDEEYLTYALKYRIALQIAQGLRYLHNETAGSPLILHRDLRTENVLLDKQGEAALADFGLAKINTQSIHSAEYHHAHRDRWHYLAPELLNVEGEATAKSDIYSFGMVMYELFSGRPPYQSSTITPEAILSGQRPKIPTQLPEVMAELIHDCLKALPHERPSAERLVNRLRSQVEYKPSNEAQEAFAKAKQLERSQHHAQAFSSYKTAGELGHAKALLKHGIYLREGRGGVAQDKVQSHRLLLLCAENGSARAQHDVGQQYEYGDGIPQDLEQARRYYHLAKQQGYPEADKRLKRVKEKLAAAEPRAGAAGAAAAAQSPQR